MSHPLQQRIAALRTRVWFLVALHGVSWIVACVLGTVIVLGLTDYLIRFQDPGLRAICSLLVLGALGWTCYRYLYLPLFVRLSDVDLALRLQRRFPALEDRLVSSVEFMKQSEDDPVAGSAALRRAVISQTTAEAERLDFSKVINARPPLRAAMVAVSICLLAAILLVVRSEASSTALLRLANPLTERTYPQKTHLMLCREVRRLARGQAFQLEVVDRDGRKLPKEVRVHYRFEEPDGSTTPETEPMRFIDGETATRGLSGAAADLRKRGVMVARRENVTRGFSYRVEGGDDSLMPWHSVEVVEPPGLDSLRVRLIPPAYTGWPSEGAKGTLIRALVETRVEISGRATRPLKSAVLHLGDGRRIDGGPTGPHRRQVAAEFVIDSDQLDSVRLDLTDEEDLPGQLGWEIRAVPDEPPVVSIKQPSDTVFVTPGAVVPLQVTAKDDLAIRQVALVFRLSSQPAEGQPGPAEDRPGPEESVLPLLNGPERVEPRPAGGLADGAESGDRREVEHRWELAGLKLSPGTQITFHAAATDYRPQTGRSDPRRLIVITLEQLQDRIAGREGQIQAELRRVLKMQRGSRSQVEALEIRLREIGRLEQLDVDRLQAAELNQREVKRILTSRSDGVPAHVLALLADLENNKIDSPDVRRRMQDLLDQIDRLQREHLALIGRELTAAIKSAEAGLQAPPPEPDDNSEKAKPTDDGARVATSLAEAGKHQDAVIAWLEDSLGRLTQWDNYRRFHREISQLLRDQQQLRDRSSELGRDTLGMQLKDLLPQQIADLKILAGRQLELARQFDRIQDGMGRAVVELRESDPLAAETVSDALAEARRVAISGQMLSAGGHLERNQIGQATAGQGQIIEDLQEVLDILANRRQHELARLVKKLSEAQAELAELQRREAELRKKMQQAAQNADQAERRRQLQRLAKQQAQLQEETQRMARRLKRLLADRAAQATGQAAGQMGQAGQCAGQGNGQGASQQAQAAEKSLQEAQRQLAARRLQAQAELAVEQLARLEDTLKHFRGRQQAILDETRRIAGLQEDQGDLTRAQLLSLGGLARQQGALQTETVQLGDQLLGAGAFQLALSRAGRYMGQAAAMLHRQQVGPPTQEAEENALGRFDLLLEALKKEPPADGQAGGASGGTGGQGGRPGAVQMLAELKLVKLLQEELNLRTAQLQKAAAAGLTDEQKREYALLSEEQARLADLVLQLLQTEQGDPEDDPAALPDGRNDQDQDEPGRLPPKEQIP